MPISSLALRWPSGINSSMALKKGSAISGRLAENTL